jgi:hypothetical protein
MHALFGKTKIIGGDVWDLLCQNLIRCDCGSVERVCQPYSDELLAAFLRMSLFGNDSIVAGRQPEYRSRYSGLSGGASAEKRRHFKSDGDILTTHQG